MQFLSSLPGLSWLPRTAPAKLEAEELHDHHSHCCFLLAVMSSFIDFLARDRVDEARGRQRKLVESQVQSKFMR